MTNNELNIQCPHCGEAFELTEALAAPLLQNERNKTEAEVSRRLNAEIEAIRKQARDAAEVEAASKIQAAETQAAETSKLLKDAQAKELAVRKDREKLQQERAAMDLEVQRRVDAEKKRAIEVGKAAASKEWEAKLQALQSDVNAKDARLREAERAELEARQLKQQAEEQKRQLELTITRRLQEERAQVVAEARAAAEKDWQTRLEAATSELASKNAKLQEAERAELEARKLKAKAEDAMRQAELTVVRRLDEERAKVREEAMRERDVEHRLKLGEKDKQLDEMRAQIEELRRARRPASCAAASCGRPNAPRAGIRRGWRSYARTSAQPRPTSPRSFPKRCRNTSGTSTRWNRSGSAASSWARRWRLRCGKASWKPPVREPRRRAPMPRRI